MDLTPSPFKGKNKQTLVFDFSDAGSEKLYDENDDKNSELFGKTYFLENEQKLFSKYFSNHPFDLTHKFNKDFH